jgi:hypothetical protein
MRAVFFAAAAAFVLSPAFAQSLVPPPSPPGVEVPDWALPQSATHKQVAPPLDFHRAPVTVNAPIGQFENQTDVGAALAPGNASYDGKTYTISSAGYNIWYQRDEFRYLWKKMSGDVSLAASVVWPDISEFHDRKVALVIRDSLDDDSRTIVAAQHGNGMVHIAWRGEKTGMMTDISHRMARQPDKSIGESGAQAIHASRIGIEKRGDQFQLWVSWQGEPIHPEGAPITFKTSGPVYVGIGFTSHLAANALTAKVSDVVLENSAGKIR